MKELEKYVTIKKINSEKYNLLFIDFNDDNVPDVCSKESLLTQTDKSIAKDLLIKKIIELSSTNKKMIEEFSAIDILKEPNETILKRKIILKILKVSTHIAMNGRIGMPNTILVSKENYEKLNLSCLENYEIFLDDSVDDIYVYRKNTEEQPGLLLITSEDKYELVDIGFYPEKQFMKISLK